MMTMGEFRELTTDVPDEWPVLLQVPLGGDQFAIAQTDATVDVTNRAVEILDDTHVKHA